MPMIRKYLLYQVIDVPENPSVVVLGHISKKVLVGEKLRLKWLATTVGWDVNFVDHLLWQAGVCRAGIEGLVGFQVRGLMEGSLRVLLCVQWGTLGLLLQSRQLLSRLQVLFLYLLQDYWHGVLSRVVVDVSCLDWWALQLGLDHLRT